MTTPTAPVAGLIHAVSDDPEVKAAARALALEAIAMTRTIINHGTPTLRMSMLKSVLPTAFAGLKEAPEDAGSVEARAKMDEIIKLMQAAPNIAHTQ